ncbi:hypothetical protein LY76DRAFT_331051 [Colletotrichum caudatum]|nr:hypothetical protein LY76DRAFT_331051 [Colletotrichum caudatum]
MRFRARGRLGGSGAKCRKGQAAWFGAGRANLGRAMFMTRSFSRSACVHARPNGLVDVDDVRNVGRDQVWVVVCGTTTAFGYPASGRERAGAGGGVGFFIFFPRLASSCERDKLDSMDGHEFVASFSSRCGGFFRPEAEETSERKRRERKKGKKTNKK